MAQQGIITFTEGVQNSQAPAYTITMDATACATISKDKTQIKTSNSNAHEISLELLEERMKNDLTWQQTVLDSLAKKDRSLPSGSTLNDHISNFFIDLRIKGYESREEKDCRTHFYNKLVKDLKSEKNENQFDKYDKRRGCGVSAAKPQDYDAPF